jgi:transcriptional regulator with XRE-family HTH domain
MAQGTTPMVQQRRLRAELRRAREAAGHTQKTVAKEMGWSLSKFIRMETGATSVSPAEARALIQYYNINDQARVDNLLALIGGREESWWDEYLEIFSQQFLNFLAFEDSASHISQYQALQIPGLLQTEAYARTRFRIAGHEDHVVERAVRVRLRRQKILDQLQNKKFEFILDEAATRRRIGNEETMIEQLTRIKSINELDNPSISVRIVPFTAGVNPSMKASFEIMEFMEEDHDFIVNVEDPNRDVLIRDNPETSSNYIEAFVQLKEIALTTAETNELIDSVVQDLRSGRKI